ncbi:MAG: hypothetical protein R2774_12045 [Saprospiraceae bacterium]
MFKKIISFRSAHKLLMGSMLVFSLFAMQSCDKDDDVTEDKNDDVFELAIRKINTGVSINDFTTARDAFVTELMKQNGTSNDREVQPFFDFSQSLPLDSVYIGMTQYKDLATYQSIGQTLGTTSVATNFFTKFTPLAFEALQPLDEYKPVDLGALAPKSSGRVLEIAVRDLSLYSNFNQADYEAKRDAFLAALKQQNGFVQEVQWKSVTNPNVVVGMTVYESQTAAATILSNVNFVTSSAVVNFLGSYPPNKVATINTVLK